MADKSGYDPNRCWQWVYTGFYGHPTKQCERKGSIKEDGHGWCRQHAPSLVKARDAARVVQIEAESHRQRESWARKDKAEKLLAAIEPIWRKYKLLGGTFGEVPVFLDTRQELLDAIEKVLG